jgi:hypothetical protein
MWVRVIARGNILGAVDPGRQYVSQRRADHRAADVQDQVRPVDGVADRPADRDLAQRPAVIRRVDVEDDKRF